MSDCMNVYVRMYIYVCVLPTSKYCLRTYTTTHCCVNKHRHSWIVIALCFIGNIDLVCLLLDHGASTSVLTPGGQLFRCVQFAGVQHILEQHHKRHCVEIFEAIADKKGFQRLTSLFLVSTSFSFSPDRIWLTFIAHVSHNFDDNLF